MRPAQFTIGEIASLVESGEITPLELTAAALERIARDDSKIGAFVHVDGNQAMIDAQCATDAIAKGQYRGTLHGIPIGVKDMIDVSGMPTAANSRVNGGRLARADATVVERLRRSGAIVLGKTRTHEYAFGVTTPGTVNPWAFDRIPGGSSGGSGAALAAGMCFAALGTDTGGSVRIPAALCGVVGLKPTFGAVPKSGVVPLSWALDHVGPMARSVEDVRTLLLAMAGAHDGDPTSSRQPLVRAPDSLRQLVIGISTEVGDMEAAVSSSVWRAVSELSELGAIVKYVDTPDTSYYGHAIFSTVLPEAASYHHSDLRDQSDLYGDDVRKFLEMGSMFLASDYIAAQRLRAVAKQDWKKVFSGVDVILSPTVPGVAPVRGTEEFTYPNGTKESFMNACMRSVSTASFTGLPAVSVPAGIDALGLPLALQVTARPFEDETALLVGESIEQIFGRPGIALKGDVWG